MKCILKKDEDDISKSIIQTAIQIDILTLILCDCWHLDISQVFIFIRIPTNNFSNNKTIKNTQGKIGVSYLKKKRVSVGKNQSKRK